MAKVEKVARYVKISSGDANRVMNMLRDDDLMLKRVGAKRVYFQNKEPEVLALLEKELCENFGKANTRSG